MQKGIFILFTLFISFISCRKDSSCQVDPNYHFLAGKWNLVYTEIDQWNTYHDLHFTTTTLPGDNYHIRFDECYTYFEFKNDNITHQDIGVFSTNWEGPDFTFEFDLNRVDNSSNSRPTCSASSTYFSLKGDTLMAKGAYIYQSKYQGFDGGWGFINKKTSHVFVRE